MQVKTILMDALAIDRALKRISHEIIENNKGVKNVVLLGIARGGVPICEKLSKNISEIEQVNILFDKMSLISCNGVEDETTSLCKLLLLITE